MANNGHGPQNPGGANQQGPGNQRQGANPAGGATVHHLRQTVLQGAQQLHDRNQQLEQENQRLTQERDAARAQAQQHQQIHHQHEEEEMHFLRQLAQYLGVIFALILFGWGIMALNSHGVICVPGTHCGQQVASAPPPANVYSNPASPPAVASAPPVDLAPLTAKVNKVESDIAALSSKIDGKAEKSEVVLQTTYDEGMADIGAIQAVIKKNIADLKEEVTTLTNSFASYEDRFRDLGSAIEKIRLPAGPSPTATEEVPIPRPRVPLVPPDTVGAGQDETEVGENEGSDPREKYAAHRGRVPADEEEVLARRARRMLGERGIVGEYSHQMTRSAQEPPSGWRECRPVSAPVADRRANAGHRRWQCR